MALINCYHIKSPNGMAYYAIEVLNDLGNDSILIARKSMSHFFSGHVKSRNLVITSLFGYIVYLLRNREETIWNISLYFFPYIFSKQYVTIHDLYPFQNRSWMKVDWYLWVASIFRVKFILISESLRTSNALTRISKESLIIPNKLPTEALVPESVSIDSLTIGLIGTDSLKKSYEDFLAEMKDYKCKFVLYGQPNAYTERLMRENSSLNISIVNSEDVNPVDFLRSCSVVVSNSIDEGFGRLNAIAVSMNIPLVLRECEVYREFYDNYAVFFHNPSSIRYVIENVVYTTRNNDSILSNWRRKNYNRISSLQKI